MTSYTKNYYRILGLDDPPSGTTIQADNATVKKAYRRALLAAHPDKSSAALRGNSDEGDYTVDDVKEAWDVLRTAETKRTYDAWFTRRGQDLGHTEYGARWGRESDVSDALDADFVLGLEVLDLADFEEVCYLAESLDTRTPPASFTSSPRSEVSGASPASMDAGQAGSDAEEGIHRDVVWIRPCRCGARQGFNISEGELESAAERGETEVLVGCEGCSLWVRVGFGVEEG